MATTMATTVTGLTAHAAEVYFRAATEVNAAISEVADRECAAGFAPHTGRSPAAHMG